MWADSPLLLPRLLLPVRLMGQLQGPGLPLGDVVFPAGKVKMREWVGLGRLQMFSFSWDLNPSCQANLFLQPPTTCPQLPLSSFSASSARPTEQPGRGKRLGQEKEGGPSPQWPPLPELCFLCCRPQPRGDPLVAPSSSLIRLLRRKGVENCLGPTPPPRTDRSGPPCRPDPHRCLSERTTWCHESQARVACVASSVH